VVESAFQVRNNVLLSAVVGAEIPTIKHSAGSGGGEPYQIYENGTPQSLERLARERPSKELISMNALLGFRVCGLAMR
jgi:hypothetical protein